MIGKDFLPKEGLKKNPEFSRAFHGVFFKKVKEVAAVDISLTEEVIFGGGGGGGPSRWSPYQFSPGLYIVPIIRVITPGKPMYKAIIRGYNSIYN